MLDFTTEFNQYLLIFLTEQLQRRVQEHPEADPPHGGRRPLPNLQGGERRAKGHGHGGPVASKSPL